VCFLPNQILLFCSYAVAGLCTVLVLAWRLLVRRPAAAGLTSGRVDSYGGGAARARRSLGLCGRVMECFGWSSRTRHRLFDDDDDSFESIAVAKRSGDEPRGSATALAAAAVAAGGRVSCTAALRSLLVHVFSLVLALLPLYISLHFF
jgi:hypothetical protein